MTTSTQTIAPLLMLLAVTGFVATQPSQAASMAVQFQVLNFWTAQPLPNAVILLAGPVTLNQTTNQAGNASVALLFGTYTITISKTDCSQIGPQPFIANQTNPLVIVAKLQCPTLGSPPLVNPHVQTDLAQYQVGQIIHWTTTGFAPGAYLQPCLADLCGSVTQSTNAGTAEGDFVVDARVQAGNQTFTANDISSTASAEVQVLILA